MGYWGDWLRRNFKLIRTRKGVPISMAFIGYEPPPVGRGDNGAMWLDISGGWPGTLRSWNEHAALNLGLTDVDDTWPAVALGNEQDIWEAIELLELTLERVMAQVELLQHIVRQD